MVRWRGWTGGGGERERERKRHERERERGTDGNRHTFFMQLNATGHKDEMGYRVSLSLLSSPSSCTAILLRRNNCTPNGRKPFLTPNHRNLNGRKNFEHFKASYDRERE
jgi:hypothetical protein